ncbi:MAG: hypothetical protein ABGY24_00735, partial [bacterium]
AQHVCPATATAPSTHFISTEPTCNLQAGLLEDFLLPMLDFDPMHRATARQCRAHPWLTYSGSDAN